MREIQLLSLYFTVACVAAFAFPFGMGWIAEYALAR